MKRIIAVLLALTLMCVFPVASASAEEEPAAKPSFAIDSGLYAHATTDKTDTEAWQRWQYPMDERNEQRTSRDKYFFLPCGTDGKAVDIYNAFPEDAVLDGVTIPSGAVARFEYTDRQYAVKVGSDSYNLRFLKSDAEAAIFVNNTNADGNGTWLYDYLKQSKSLTSTAAGAIVSPDGTVDNTKIKKIKGRGNTTWGKSKKPFNITYSSAVSIGGMDKGKKYSLLANYQDASLARNRFLYDLSDAVGMPYASDSRFVDFYINGTYYGSYQCCQKIEVGKNDLINDISDTDYVNGKEQAKDFSFVLEIDPSPSEDDYHFRASSTELTINSPELDQDNPFYESVKSAVAEKFSALNNLIANRGATEQQLSAVMDIDSFAEIYLINELGKNWDSGAASFYMTYKKSPDGVWRFYASPVWDYDNSLGNAAGIEWDLDNMGVKDYESYEGWWCRYKGKSKNDKSTKNFVGRLAQNTAVYNRAAALWFERFIPALNIFKNSDAAEGELLSCSRYYELLRDSAQMNYARGWALNTGSWIADHSSLCPAVYELSTDTYTVGARKSYPATFKGEFDYAADWMNSRAAWLSKQFRSSYEAGAGEALVGDVNCDGVVNITDVTLIQLVCAGYGFADYNRKSADFDGNGTADINDATAVQKHIAGL